MKNTITLLTLAALSLATSAATTKSTFTCEMIKDKPTRTTCIEARNQAALEEQAKAAKAEAEKQEAERIAAEQAAKEAELLRAKNDAEERVGKFVASAKVRINARLKDPDSAKYSQLVLLTHKSGQRTLCGAVNAKNSYGGYVGLEYFHVTEEPIQPQVFMTGGSNPSGLTALMDKIKATETHQDLCDKPNSARSKQDVVAG
jgi:hypothetical protein